MKILMIAPQPFYSERGTPMNVRLVCKVLGEAGHSLDLLVFPVGRDIKLPNVRIIRLPNFLRISSIPVGPSRIKLAFDVLLTVYGLMLCMTKRYDIIHGIEEGGFLAVIFAKFFRKRSIFDMDSSISDQLNYSGFIRNSTLLRYIRAFEAWAIRHSSLVITVCSALSETAYRLVPEANVVQIEDIPSPDIKEYDQEVVDSLIQQYQLSGVRKVVYTGNLESYQGIDLLLAAWRIFVSEKKDEHAYRLMIVGGQTEKVDHYKRLIEDGKAVNTICFVGPRPVHEMGAWMALSDILVSPRSEGNNTPLKIYSYMSSCRPIVATRRRTHTQVLNDSMAFLAEPSPAPFAEAISVALSHPDLAEQKAFIAKETVEENYSYNTFARKLLKAYCLTSRWRAQ